MLEKLPLILRKVRVLGLARIKRSSRNRKRMDAEFVFRSIILCSSVGMTGKKINMYIFKTQGTDSFDNTFEKTTA